MPTTVLAESNFLIPNGTFLAELVAFAVILAVVYRFVVPPLQRAMRQRAELISAQLDEARQARERAESAQAEYAASMNEARAEGARIREEARAQGQAIVDEKRAQAQSEVDRLHQQGRQTLLADRDAMAGGLRSEMGSLAIELAGRIVGEPLAEQARSSGTVERFLREQADEATATTRDPAADPVSTGDQGR